MEIDTLHCDVIVRRWEQFTGMKAKRASGATLDNGTAGGTIAPCLIDVTRRIMPGRNAKRASKNKFRDSQRTPSGGCRPRRSASRRLPPHPCSETRVRGCKGSSTIFPGFRGKSQAARPPTMLAAVWFTIFGSPIAKESHIAMRTLAGNVTVCGVCVRAQCNLSLPTLPCAVGWRVTARLAAGAGVRIVFGTRADRRAQASSQPGTNFWMPS